MCIDRFTNSQLAQMTTPIVTNICAIGHEDSWKSTFVNSFPGETKSVNGGKVNHLRCVLHNTTLNLFEIQADDFASQQKYIPISHLVIYFVHKKNLRIENHAGQTTVSLFTIAEKNRDENPLIKGVFVQPIYASDKHKNRIRHPKQYFPIVSFKSDDAIDIEDILKVLSVHKHLFEPQLLEKLKDHKPNVFNVGRIDRREKTLNATFKKFKPSDCDCSLSDPFDEDGNLRPIYFPTKVEIDPDTFFFKLNPLKSPMNLEKDAAQYDVDMEKKRRNFDTNDVCVPVAKRSRV